jgi:dihydrofolate reductase
MGKVTVEISVSLDGYVAGPNQSPDEPLGEGGEQLHEWVVAQPSWKERHGLDDAGEQGPEDALTQESIERVGATVMGRGMFGGGPGDWDESWQGWWGDDPPFHHPVFVLTHHAREPLTLGDTTFTFVTDGIESALEQARAAAGDKDVQIAGGGQVDNEYLAAGLVDEIWLHITPVLLGGGSRLFEGVGPAKLEQVRSVESGYGVAHGIYRVVK